MGRTVEVILESNKQRFVAMELRDFKSDIPASFWERIARNSCYINWKGIPMQKGPFQIITTQQLIQEIKPKTIVEFGSFKGGSALWLADIQETCVTNGKVISVDISLDNIDVSLKEDSRIEFIQGDSNKIERIFSKKQLAKLLHPILLIEDAHINTSGILEYFHQNVFSQGDYFVVEDTNMDYNEACYQVWKENVVEEECFNKLDNLNNKIIKLKNWLKDKNEMYLADTKYLDPFGIKNASKNWDSVFKRVK